MNRQSLEIQRMLVTFNQDILTKTGEVLWAKETIERERQENKMQTNDIEQIRQKVIVLSNDLNSFKKALEDLI